MGRYSAAILLAVLLVCSEARREKFGKLSGSRFSRQIDHREYRQFAPQEESVVNYQQQENNNLAPQVQPRQASFRQVQAVDPRPVQAVNIPQAVQAPQPQATNFQARQLPVQAQQPQARQLPVQAQQPQATNNFQARQLPVQAQQPQATNFQSRQLPVQAQPQPQAINFQAQPSQARPVPQAQPQFQNNDFQNNLVNQVLNQKPAHSQLIGFRQVGGGVYPGVNPGIIIANPPAGGAPGAAAGTAYPQQQTKPLYAPGSLLSKLPDNSSLIRPNIVEGFSCEGRGYGYYADTLNDCQIFHVCYPLKDVFKLDPAVDTVNDVTYQFSFICNKYTKFAQDSLTCAWAYEALPCELAPQFYVRNEEFFKTTAKPPTAGPAQAVNPGYPGASINPAGPANVGGNVISSYPTGK